MTTTTTTATLNIIKALPRWVQASLEINGTPDGWVPAFRLDLFANEIFTAYEANIIDIKDDTARLTLRHQLHLDSEVRFIEENVITIYNWLQ